MCKVYHTGLQSSATGFLMPDVFEFLSYVKKTTGGGVKLTPPLPAGIGLITLKSTETSVKFDIIFYIQFGFHYFAVQLNIV